MSATATRTEIAAALGNAGVFRAIPRDGVYALPSRQWLATFATRFRNWRVNELDGEPYEPEANDCDDASGDAWYYARKCHRRTVRAGNGPANSALAFGFMDYQTERGGGHSINCAVCRENGALAVVFWEPQTGQEVQLTEDERSSACVTI